MSTGASEPGSAAAEKVFITYRREETAAHAGRLYDAMVARFGEANVFMDVDMAPGVDFVERITEAVAACHVLIVVMGPRWATVADEQGTPRLADPEDIVRLEVETALRRPEVTPIPVLVAGARMPSREALPPEVRAITRRNALELGDQRWRDDVERLISTLDELLAESPLVPGSPSPERSITTGKATPADAGQAAGQIALPSTPTVPHQLPGGAAAFIGRRTELTVLTRFLEDARKEDGGTASCTAGVFGGPGLGKTMLAVHWAYSVAEEFSDGQLYVDLRGFDAVDPPMLPATAIRSFLGAFGLSAERIPRSFEEQAALYRTLLWDRWVLVILDNARDDEQVYPLLPGRGFVVVTSRNTLRGLVAKGAQPITLDLLTESEAVQLISRYVGGDRAAAEPAAVRDLVKLTSRLPLAAAVVGSRALTSEQIPLSALAKELRDEPDLLEALETGEILTSVESVFSWSYRAFSPEAARMFRLVGLHPGPTISVGGSAALTGTTVSDARRLVDELTRAHFLQEPAPGRFHSHDLLKAYASKLAARHDSENERRSALTRAFDYYLHTAFSADQQLYPYRHPIEVRPPDPGIAPRIFKDTEEAGKWFREEISTLLAVAAYASQHGYVTHAWQLPWTFATFVHRQGAWHDYLLSQKAALDAAEETADPAVIARVERNIGRPYTLLGLVDEALVHYERSLAMSRDANDRTGEALCDDAIAWQYGRISRHEDAIEHAERALLLWRDIGSKAGEARALNYAGWNRGRLGRYEEALEPCTAALRLFREIGNAVGEADTLDSLGYLDQHLGDRERAIDLYTRSIALWHQLGDRYNEADVLSRLGDVHRDDGNLDLAVKAWRDALAILDDLGHPDAGAIREKLDAAPALDDAATKHG